MSGAGSVALSIPSPSTGVWEVFGLPLRAYALCIIAGIIVAMIIANRRWVARGGSGESIEMVAVVAVPCGIVGARLYHVITDYPLYFAGGRRGAGRLSGGSTSSNRFSGAARCRGTGHRGGASYRPARQLVQPGALRAADLVALGAADRSGSSPARLRAVSDLPPHLSLRAGVESAGSGRAGAAGPQVPARARQGLRAVCDLLHPGALLDRGIAHRSGQ